MSSIHYKFRSSLEYDTITFDGQAISLSDLREAIMTRKKILKTPSYTLEITNAQTKEVYNDDETMVPKNSSVIVKRVPSQRHAAVSDQANGLSKEEEELTELAFDRLTKTANLATANASEEDKIEAMMEQSKEGFDPRLYQKSVPFNYTCHRCGKKGHHVKSCPTIGDSRFNTKITNNRPSGIPKEFFLRKIQHETEIIKRLRDLQDKNSRFSPVVGSDLVDQSKVPAELQCPMCKRLFTDVVVTPCCGDSYCDECIRNYLVENDIVCVCGETTSPDNLIANKSLRNSVNNFRNQKKSDMKSVPPSPVSQTTSSGMTDVVSQPAAVATSIESQPSPQPVIKVEPAVTQHQQPPDTNSENSLNGTTSISNAPSPAVPDITDSPKKPIITEKPDIAPDGKLVLNAETKTLLVSQGAPVLQSAPVVASIHQPGLIAGGSIAAQVLPGTSIAGGQNVIYTHGAQTSLRHPGYTNYIQRQPVIPGQPGLLPGAIQYGLNLAPGTTIVKRLVPVPVGPPRIGLPQSNIIRYTATPIARQVPPDLLPAEPNIERPLPHEPNRHHNERYKRDEPRVPMTEDEFYLWQQQAKKRSSRHRRRSLSPEGNRYHSRSRSRTPTDKRRRRRNEVYEDSGEDSGLEKIKSREKTKKKNERRHRDSSQDSIQNEKIRSRAKKKKERHIPEHIKRELDEFEFDNEVEFDEELRKIKKRAKLKAKKMKKEQSPESSSSEDSESTKEELVSPERQTEEDSTLGAEKHGSDSPEEKMEEPLNEEKTEDSVIPEENDNVHRKSPVKDTQVEEDLLQEKVNESEETEVKDHNNEENIENKDKVVPPSDGQKKKKTKIIKRKVVRVVKVRRKKSVVEQSSVEVAKPDDSNDSSMQNSEATVAQHTNDQQSAEQESADKEVISEPKRKIPQLPDHFKSPTKKMRTISYEVKNEAEALLEKRKAKKKLLAAKLEKIANNSPSKVEAAAAAVRAKKEAEKKALLEKAKRAKRIKEARELKEAKSIEEEEKRRRREKYILAKQKKLKEKEKLKNLEGDILSIEDKKLQRKLAKQQEEPKKPDQQFYKPGEAKLKTLSEMTKQRLKQSEGEHKKRTNEGDETGESDVLKSKVTSLHKVISPDKNRKMIKTSVSEEEKEYSKSQLSQSVDEISHRRIVKLADSKRKNLSSRVEKLERNEKGKETSESHRVRKDSSDHTDSLERLRIERRRQREEDEQRRDAKEKKRRQLEKEREDRKRLQALEKEKQESYERERQAIREKEKLERKLQQEREIFEQMLKIKQLEKEKSKRLLEHRKYGKRKSSEESEEELTSKSRKNKKIDKKKPNYIIQIMDSENEKSDSDVNESESSSEESEKEKKRKRKSKKKKEKRKSKKRKQVSEDEDEEDSNNTSDEDEEDDRRKKKKKKHKRSKHKKHRKSRKHKKKSKKRKTKRKESSSGSESEDNEEDEEVTEDSKDKDEETEESEKQSDKEKPQKSTKKKSKPSSSESSEEESVDEDNEERKTETESESKVDENSDTGKAEGDDDKMTKENQRKLKSEMSETKTESEVKSTKEVDSNKTENSKKEGKFSKVVKRRETLEGDEIELDYNEDELDNEALYGDLNFADDEQTNPNIKTVNEPRDKEENTEEVEEGEIPDEDVFEPSPVNTTFKNEKDTDKSTEESLDLNKSDVDIDDIYDTDIEKAVTDAINELSKEKMTAPEKSELSDEIENVSIPTGKS